MLHLNRTSEGIAVAGVVQRFRIGPGYGNRTRLCFVSLTVGRIWPSDIVMGVEREKSNWER
jgi:hypothetical protein